MKESSTSCIDIVEGAPKCKTCGSDTCKGKVVRCYFESPEGRTEYPFLSRSDGTIVANLEDYAIIPIKTWEKLTGRKFS